MVDTHEIIQIFPKGHEGSEMKKMKHKWAIVITNKKVAKQLEDYIRHMSSVRMIHIDGNEEMEKFIGDEKSLMHKINVAILDNATISMNSIVYENDTEIWVVYTGMKIDEVQKYYDELLNKIKSQMEEKNGKS